MLTTLVDTAVGTVHDDWTLGKISGPPYEWLLYNNLLSVRSSMVLMAEHTTLKFEMSEACASIEVI